MLVKARPKDRGALSLGVLKEWFPCSLIRLTRTREVLTLDSGPSPSPALSTLSITGTSIVLNESDFEPLQTFLKLRPMLPYLGGGALSRFRPPAYLPLFLLFLHTH